MDRRRRQHPPIKQRTCLPQLHEHRASWWGQLKWRITFPMLRVRHVWVTPDRHWMGTLDQPEEYRAITTPLITDRKCTKPKYSKTWNVWMRVLFSSSFFKNKHYQTFLWNALLGKCACAFFKINVTSLDFVIKSNVMYKRGLTV